MKQRVVVICPGRGTYTKETLGYLQKKYFNKTREQAELLQFIDEYRRDKNQPIISELDAASTFSINQHLTGDNASALIYTCAMMDFLSIDRERFDIVAVTGNSMGWYLALACAGAISMQHGMHIVNSMGTRMHQQAPGGQLIYPVCDENWQYDATLENNIAQAKKQLNNEGLQVFDSIFLGGMRVLAAENTVLRKLLKALPSVQDRYPFSLVKHGAFHTPLMNAISQTALNEMDRQYFQIPAIPLVDGSGRIWQNYDVNTSAAQQEMFDYTFSQQVCAPYDYSKAIEIATKEFSPDKLIILGPGSTLGSPTAQQLISMNWLNLTSKQDFKKLQCSHPFILSMGLEEQSALVSRQTT